MGVKIFPTLANTCKIPFHPNRKYEIEVKDKPNVLDNVIYWQVFDSDKEVEFVSLTLLKINNKSKY